MPPVREWDDLPALVTTRLPLPRAWAVRPRRAPAREGLVPVVQVAAHPAATVVPVARLPSNSVPEVLVVQEPVARLLQGAVVQAAVAAVVVAPVVARQGRLVAVVQRANRASRRGRSAKNLKCRRPPPSVV